jgi:hypothetical protein
MKSTFAVALLIGAISAAEPVWSLRSVNDHRTDSEVQKAYGDHSTVKANGRPPYQSAVQVDSESESESSSEEENVQVMGDDSESDHSKEFYNAWNAVKDEEEGYHRAIPAYFSGDSDDLFMRSMCKTYALEGKNKDGSPNGNFVMDEATTRAAASEVLGTHKGLSGDAKKKYLDTYFPRTFAHFDVTKGGKLEVIKMPQFMRFLASDQYMSLLP